MNKFLIYNARAFTISALMMGAGYCLGGHIGLGIALVLILLMQLG